MFLFLQTILGLKHQLSVDKSFTSTLTVSTATNQLIFLQELITNAKDAYQKLIMEHGNEEIVIGRNIRLTIKENKFILSDGAIGMSEQEIIDFVGRIGGSGSRDKKECIGRFGIGMFYAFLVADKFTLVTKKYKSEKAYKCEFTLNEESYDLEETEKEDFGTEITLEIRENQRENITPEKIKEWFQKNMVETRANALYDIILVTEEEATLNFMPFPSSVDSEEIKSAYKDIFKGQNFIHASKSTFFIEQEQGVNKIKNSVYFEANILVPEINDMRLMGIENKGEHFLFVNGMKIEMKEIPEFIKPFYLVITSSQAETNSTRERLKNEVDYKNNNNALMNELIKILKKLLKNTETKEKVINSYNKIIKEAALHLNKEKNSDLANRLLSISSFDTLNEKVLLEEIEGECIYYTDVPVKSVKMRNGVINPNFDGFNEKFICISGFTDEQLVAAFKNVNGKPFKNISSVSYGDKTVSNNVTFDTFVKERLGYFVTGSEPSKRLINCPFGVKSSSDSISPSMKQLMGENEIDGSFLKSFLFKLPVLEYNPDNDEFIKILDLIEVNPHLAEEVLKGYVIAVSMISRVDVDDKIGAYISITNVCKNVLGFPMVEDKFVPGEKSPFDFKMPPMDEDALKDLKEEDFKDEDLIDNEEEDLINEEEEVKNVIEDKIKEEEIKKEEIKEEIKKEEIKKEEIKEEKERMDL